MLLGLQISMFISECFRAAWLANHRSLNLQITRQNLTLGMLMKGIKLSGWQWRLLIQIITV